MPLILDGYTALKGIAAEVVMRILFLSAWYPLPADNGSKLRILHLLRGLARYHSVDLLVFAPDAPDEAAAAELRALCQDVEIVPETPFRNSSGGRLRGLLSTQPRSVVANHSVAMAAAVQGRARRGYDLVIASQLHMAPYALLVPHTPRVLEEVELGIIHDQQSVNRNLRAQLRFGLTWWKTHNYVADLVQQFSGATVASDREWALLRPYAPDDLPIAVVPNGVDLAACAGDYGSPEPDTLIYPGAISYHANYDAVAFFATEMLPRIRAERPDTRLIVTGKAQPEQVAALAGAGIEFAGYVDDIRAAVGRAWAEVVPLRTGGGTRLKVLEALALGTPLVSTTKGVEGLELQAERDVLIADDPAEFAAQTLRLLASPILRATLQANGRRAVAAYDWSRSVSQLLNLIETAHTATANKLSSRTTSF